MDANPSKSIRRGGIVAATSSGKLVSLVVRCEINETHCYTTACMVVAILNKTLPPPTPETSTKEATERANGLLQIVAY